MAVKSSARNKQKVVTFVRASKWREARDECVKITKANPRDPEAWYMLASVSEQLGRTEEVISSYQTVLRLTAGSHAETHYNLGVTYQKLGRLEEAMASYREALRINPSLGGAYNNAGMISEALGRPIEALSYYIEIEARRLNPELAKAQSGISRIINQSENWAGAEEILVDVVRKSDGDPHNHCHLGELYWSQGRWKDAEQHYREALERDNTLVDAWIGLGNTLQDQGQFVESGPCYEQAIALAPDNSAAHYNRGSLDMRQMKLAEALLSFDRAISLKPDFVEAHWHKSFVCLLTGDYAQGWREYEWRHRRKDNIYIRPFTQPVWDGSDLNGRTILVHDEQGFGDTFQFSRYLQLVKARGGRVIFECHRGLRTVLSGCVGYDQLIERTTPPEIPQVEFDVQVHLMSLPGILGTDLDSIPNETPYINADPARIEKWRELLVTDSGFKVGIAWAGSPKHTNDVSRSCRLEQFAVLSQVPGVTLYSLQKGAGATQADALPSGMNLIRLDKELDNDAPFVDTAAVMANMDLIITIDTSIAHLAGALGRPTWTLLCTMPDWRFLLDRPDCPWYPQMRLFRQQKTGDWQSVFGQAASALKEMLENFK